jgi:hypothetical protein
MSDFKMRPFCAKGHEREKMDADPMLQRFFCPLCKFQVTYEKVHHDIPKEYRFLFDATFGVLAASLLDIGGIDLIYDNAFMPKIEYPRERQV